MCPSSGADLTSYVAQCLRDSCAGEPDFQGHVVAGRRAISSAIVDGCDLDAMWRESDPDKRLPGKYRRHQVVTDTEWGFTVVVLLWEPGAITPIHDHDTWCVFGLLEGALEVTNYQVLSDDGKTPLQVHECGREILRAGVTGDNLEEDTEVHRVRNVGSERAVSLHLYGDDLTKRKHFSGRGVRVDGKGECFAFQQQTAY